RGDAVADQRHRVPALLVVPVRDRVPALRAVPPGAHRQLHADVDRLTAGEDARDLVGVAGVREPLGAGPDRPGLVGALDLGDQLGIAAPRAGLDVVGTLAAPIVALVVQ